jgi:hypothetical protein
MPKYMTQKMSSGVKKAITYYRDGGDHPSHETSSKFTKDAKNAYALARGVDVSTVEEGTYKSGQGVPSGGDCVAI